MRTSVTTVTLPAGRVADTPRAAAAKMARVENCILAVLLFRKINGPGKEVGVKVSRGLEAWSC